MMMNAVFAADAEIGSDAVFAADAEIGSDAVLDKPNKDKDTQG
jgi:UDP-3-O-[3-hydroxymyristoyl] glucosamine N-acyltransferase